MHDSSIAHSSLTRSNTSIRETYTLTDDLTQRKDIPQTRLTHKPTALPRSPLLTNTQISDPAPANARREAKQKHGEPPRDPLGKPRRISQMPQARLEREPQAWGERSPYLLASIPSWPISSPASASRSTIKTSISSPRQSQTSNQPIHASCPSRCARRASAYPKQHLIITSPLHIPAKETAQAATPILGLAHRYLTPLPYRSLRSEDPASTHPRPRIKSLPHPRPRPNLKAPSRVPPQFPNPKTKRPRSTS